MMYLVKYKYIYSEYKHIGEWAKIAISSELIFYVSFIDIYFLHQTILTRYISVNNIHK